ncbi:DoxX family protein [Streptomyces sp. NPDC008122]|uniref:DoxX family protein n=1 Tax=Streptomyces sp. NPDC008122 TaxID=3364810 RepID=UPI0036E96B66
MDLALWIVAGLMAVVCLLGSAKMFLPRERMAAMGASAQWVMDFSPGALKAIGALELLAAAGLTLPAVLDIAPVLVPVTATGLVLLFVGAVGMRLRRGERSTMAVDVIYLLLCLFLVWGRFGPEAFTG